MTAPAVKLPEAIVTLQDEHRYLNLLLDTLERQLGKSKLSRREDYFLLQDIVHYMHEYPDEVHHPTEDLMFEKLVRRNPERELDVARLRREHNLMRKNTEEILQLLHFAARNRKPDAIAEVRAAIEKYIAYQRKHIEFEEAELFPSAARCLSNNDWHDIEIRLEASQDPLFGPTVQRDFRALYEYFSDRADRLSQQMTNFGFLQLDNMILSVDAVETGIVEMVDMLQRRAGSLGREFKNASDKSLDGRGILSALGVQLQFAGFVGKTACATGSEAAKIYLRTLKNAAVSLVRGAA